MIHRRACSVLAAIAVGLLSGMVGCGSDNPINSPAKALDTSTTQSKALDTSNRMVVLRDTAIAEPNWNYPFRWTWADTVTKTMSFDSMVGNQHLGSIFSPANNTARALSFPVIGSDPEYDSIVGVEFYLMAKASAKTNFLSFLSKETGSHGPGYYLGIGFDPSDSIKIQWDTTEVAATQAKKNIAPIQFGKWYKCTIEYNATNWTATYYIDGKSVGTHLMPSASTLGYNMFVVYRDALGQEGTAPYYFNDFTLYGIQKKSQ
jgi:hypothetical protein